MTVGALFSAAPAIAAEQVTFTLEDTGTVLIVPADVGSGMGNNPVMQENNVEFNRIQVAPTVLSTSQTVCGGLVNGKLQEPCQDRPAKFEQAAQGTCPAGTIFDLTRWSCWSCPEGFSRHDLAAIDSDRGCSRPKQTNKPRFQPATFKGPLCEEGSFFDPIRGGECWSCPNGYKRSWAHVEAGNACVVPANSDFKPSNRHGRAYGVFRTDCPSGQFWDPVDGHCYSCPSGYHRTVQHVHSPQACVQHRGEVVARATRVKSGTCQAGEFKDWKVQGEQNPDFGGGCWTCPTTYDRTVHAVDRGDACETTPELEFARANFDSALTCPSDQIFDFIGLSQWDINERRLSGVSPIQSGTCWSCPSGYSRSLTSVKGGDACRANTIGWYSAPFNNPGLFGFSAAEFTLQNIVKNNPALVRKALDKVAEAAARTSDRSLAEIRATEAQLFMTAPHRSATAAGLLLAELLRIIGTPASQRNAAFETPFLQSVTEQIRRRRTHIAEDALAAYEAWYKADQHIRSERLKLNQAGLYDLGSVPPDFTALAIANASEFGAKNHGGGLAAIGAPLIAGVLEASMEIPSGPGALGALKVGTATAAQGQMMGALAAWQSVWISQANTKAALSGIGTHAVKQGTQEVFEQTLGRVAQEATEEAIEQGAKGLGAGTKLAASIGPQVIFMISSIIFDIALHQVTESSEARGKLLTAVATAKQTPDLARLASSQEGLSVILGHWTYLVQNDLKQPSARFTNGNTLFPAFRTMARAAITGGGSTQAARVEGGAKVPDAALTLANGRTYFFYPDKTFGRFDPGARGMANGYPAAFPGGWQGLSLDFIDPPPQAAFPFPGGDKSYMFSVNRFTRLSGVQADSGYPKSLPGGWQFPQNHIPWRAGHEVDAAYLDPADRSIVLFKGQSMVRMDGIRARAGYPQQIGRDLQISDFNFLYGGYDAATARGNHVYLIKGGQYIRLTNKRQDPGYPKPLSQFPN